MKNFTRFVNSLFFLNQTNLYQDGGDLICILVASFRNLKPLKSFSRHLLAVFDYQAEVKFWDLYNLECTTFTTAYQ